MFFAANAAAASAGPFPGRIVLAALVDEEGMMLGAKHFVASGHTAGVDGVICCEPEGGEICHVAKGALRLRLDFTGKMAHGAMPSQGRNPNRGASGRVHRVAGRAGGSPCSRRIGEHPHLGQVWITPTVLRAGEPVQMNVMPADAACGSTSARSRRVDHAAVARRADRRRGRRSADDVGIGTQCRP